MVAMHPQTYKWVCSCGERGNAELCDEVVCTWSGWAAHETELSCQERRTSGGGGGLPWPTCAAQADKGVFRKVVNQRVGARRMPGCRGGSLFPPGRAGGLRRQA